MHTHSTVLISTVLLYEYVWTHRYNILKTYGIYSRDKLGKFNYWIESSEFFGNQISHFVSKVIGCIALSIFYLSPDPFLVLLNNDLAYNSEFPFSMVVY